MTRAGQLENFARALSIKCDARAEMELKKLLGPPTVAVENGGGEPRLYLYYRLDTPARSKGELKKLELARELAAGIADGVFDGLPPAHLDPKICRITNQNPDVEINLTATLEILQKAAGNGGARPSSYNDERLHPYCEEAFVHTRTAEVPCEAPTGGECSSAATKVIQLAERAQEVIEVTELEPADGTFIGKHINRDGSITQFPSVTWWRQSVERVPATIPQLFAHLCEARKRNICLIRGAPANLERQPIRKWKAGVVGSSDRGDHGFLDEPTRLLPLDVDGERINWRADPERAIRAIVGRLGEPWASASFVWFFSATHGLELDEHKRWTGRISDGSMRVRLVFITERALNEAEASVLTNIAKARVPKLDTSITRQVQANYIKRPHWIEHPDRDVLGDIPTIGWVKGTSEYLAVPDDLTHTARWAKAQGYGTDIADHPDAEAAVRSIGSDASVRSHLMAAVQHLLLANPVPDVTSFADHAITIVSQLHRMVERHRTEICNNLAQHGRHWGDVVGYFPDNMTDWAHWLLDHPTALKRKTIRLSKEKQAEPEDQVTREEIFARVGRTIERSRKGAITNNENPVTELLVAPTGSRKSTLIRDAAVRYVTEQPNKTVIILMPRHKLGDEQIELLHKEHPDGNYSAAVWRGRHADDPETPDPHRPGKYLMKMCRRDADAAAVEGAMINVESSLCKRGRGEKVIKCPFYDTCAYQQQKQIKANIWFAAHECALHEMPKAFGDVGWVIFDESPLDAFMLGVDINDQVMLGLDTLHTPLPVDPARFGRGYFHGVLMRARGALYHALDQLLVPIEFHQGVAVSRQSLKPFFDETRDGKFIAFADYCPKFMRSLTFRGKVDPEIRPDMSGEQIETKLEEAASNDTIKKETLLWELVGAVGGEAMKKREAALWEQTADLTLPELIEVLHNTKRYGRIQVHRGKEGRIIRMVGLKPLAKGWNVQTLICDATGDAELLKAIWPQLVEAEPHGWQQLPRPPNVRVFQCVNRTISKWAVAVEGNTEKEIARKTEGARRLYAAVLMKALEYGGADVGVILYKSTKDWIQKNCFVPDWLRLVHWGDVTGTNTLQHVRALFVVGRPLASPEDVTRQAEALFGAYIPQRAYVERQRHGRIPTIPDAKGNNCVLVDVQEHPDPSGERLRRQITEGSLIQAAGRARAGLRGEGEPLDIHLWTDVPVPELGPVEPVLWSELAAGPDELMLAAEGVWLRNIADAAKTYAGAGLFSARGLKAARARRGGGVDTLHIGIPIYRVSTPPIFRVIYRRAAPGCKPTEAIFLTGVADPRGWLEERLGPLAYFEVEAEAAQRAHAGVSDQ